MALNFIRHERDGGRQYGKGNRSCFFMRVFYRKEYERELEEYNSMSEEEQRKMNVNDTPPREEWKEIFKFLSTYHLYLEREYGGATGSMYSIKVSDHQLQPRGVFDCEYVQDFGSIMTFLDDYYGLTRERLSGVAIWKKYHKLGKVEFYSPAELGEKLVLLGRELYYRYHIQKWLDDENCTIKSYDIDFDFNQVNAWLEYPNHLTTGTVITA